MQTRHYCLGRGSQSACRSYDRSGKLGESGRSGSSLALRVGTNSGEGVGGSDGLSSAAAQDRRAVRLERSRNNGGLGRSDIARVSGLATVGLVGEGVREADGVVVRTRVVSVVLGI